MKWETLLGIGTGLLMAGISTFPVGYWRRPTLTLGVCLVVDGCLSRFVTQYRDVDFFAEKLPVAFVAVVSVILTSSRPAVLPPLTPPTALRAVGITPGRFVDVERKISIKSVKTACTPADGKTYSFFNLSGLPGGQSLKRPFFLIKPERYVLRTDSQDPGQVDLLLELSVTSRGQASVAKDWRVCFAADGAAFRYRPNELSAAAVSGFDNPISLELATIQQPIQRAHAVLGWLLFRVPTKVFERAFLSSIECRDYLEHRYTTTFASENAQPAPGLTAESK